MKKTVTLEFNAAARKILSRANAPGRSLPSAEHGLRFGDALGPRENLF